MNIFHPVHFIIPLLFFHFYASATLLVFLSYFFTTRPRFMPYSSTKIHYLYFSKAEILWETKHNFEALELKCLCVVKCLINKVIHMHLDLGPNRHVYRNKCFFFFFFLLLLLFYCSHESHIFHMNTKAMKVYFRIRL